MSALPSVMQAKKAELAKNVTLPSMETVKPQPIKPVVVLTQPKKEDEKKDEPLDLKEFAVGDEVIPDPSVSKEVVKPEGDSKDGQAKEDGEEERDWRWMYKSLAGNHQLLVTENRDLRDKYVALETRLGLLTEKKVEPKEEVPLDLTEEEKEEYGAALPVLNKLLTKQQRQIEDTVIKPLQVKIAELEKNTSDVAAKSQSTEADSFFQQVKMQVKNIGGDVDTILKNPKWGEFTGRPIAPYADITIGQALLDAHKKRDLGKVIKVFEDFTKSQATNSAGDAYRAPSVSAATGALPEDSTKKPMLKWSKREEASLKFRKRQISTADYEKIAALYREAEAEGRIDYDK
jgi:hypothetical protein